MDNKSNFERFAYVVCPISTQHNFQGKFLYCVMPDEQAALQLGAELIGVSESELLVKELHNGVVSDYLLKKRPVYGYCSQLTATQKTPQYVDLVFDYPWKACKTRKQIISEILKDLD